MGKAEAGPRTLGVRETYLRPLGPRFSPAAWTCPRGTGWSQRWGLEGLGPHTFP